MLLFFSMQYLLVEFDDQGNLNNITNRVRNFTVQFSAQGLYWYTSKYQSINHLVTILFTTLGFQGNNSQSEFQSSGAYYFRPFTPNPLPVSTSRNM